MSGPSNNKHPHLRDVVELNTNYFRVGLSTQSSLLTFLRCQPITGINIYNGTTPYNFTGVHKMAYNHWKSKIFLKWDSFLHSYPIEEGNGFCPTGIIVRTSSALYWKCHAIETRWTNGVPVEQHPSFLRWQTNHRKMEEIISRGVGVKAYSSVPIA